MCSLVTSESVLGPERLLTKLAVNLGTVSICDMAIELPTHSEVSPTFLTLEGHAIDQDLL